MKHGDTRMQHLLKQALATALCLFASTTYGAAQCEPLPSVYIYTPSNGERIETCDFGTFVHHADPKHAFNGQRLSEDELGAKKHTTTL